MTRISESLIKYLAGLCDADGSLSFSFRNGRNTNDHSYIGLQMCIHTSAAVDTRGFIKTLPELTSMGGYYTHGDEKFGRWLVATRPDLEMLLPRIIKHMVIKAKHWQRLLDTWREKRGKLLSGVEIEELKDFSRASRIDSPGPLKSKNHPSWAWVAGYMDGDGWFSYHPCKTSIYKGKQYHSFRMRAGAVAHENDANALRFLQKAFGGSILNHNKSGSILIWRRPLGPRDASFALGFLSKLARHSRLKRHKIDQMIHFHRQRLSTPTSAEEATV